MGLNGLHRVVISGTGSYLPEKRVTNQYLESAVETSDEWIRQRTGIVERRQAAADQSTSDLALAAAEKAIANANLAPTDIDQIILATFTGDYIFPATACLIQNRLGCRQIPSFDISAVCCGFIYALDVARNAIAAGAARHILVIGAETLTRFTDYRDRGTCILFGDGAGAAVLSRGEGDGDGGIIDTRLAADGSGAAFMILPGGGSLHPPSPDTLEKGLNFIKVEGRAVYKHAVSKIVMLVNESLERNHLTRDDIDLIIPHQMNARIIESAAKHLDIPLDKVFINIDRYGNTSAATIPIALDEANRGGRLRKGNLVTLVAFGGGMTWASALLRW